MIRPSYSPHLPSAPPSILLPRCLYGSALSVAILGGELQRSGVWEHRVMDWKTGDSARLYQRPSV